MRRRRLEGRVVEEDSRSRRCADGRADHIQPWADHECISICTRGAMGPCWHLYRGVGLLFLKVVSKSEAKKSEMTVTLAQHRSRFGPSQRKPPPGLGYHRGRARAPRCRSSLPRLVDHTTVPLCGRPLGISSSGAAVGLEAGPGSPIGDPRSGRSAWTAADLIFGRDEAVKAFFDDAAPVPAARTDVEPRA